MVETLDRWIAALGPEAYLILGLAALIEYVFPPFPGDTVMLLGGVYAARGDKSPVGVWVVLTLGSIVGAMIDYWVGTRLIVWLRQKPTRARFLGVGEEQLLAAELKMQQHGSWLILINRFVPGIRSLAFFAAGGARIPVARVVVLGGLSAGLYNLLVLLVGIAVGGNAERLESLFTQYQHVAYIGVAVVAAGVVARILWVRARRTKSSEG